MIEAQQVAALIIAMLGGMLLGFVLPSFIQLYRISQMAYQKGYESGQFKVGALVKRAQRALDACEHGPRTADGRPQIVCRNCADDVRRELKKIEIAK